MTESGEDQPDPDAQEDETAAEMGRPATDPEEMPAAGSDARPATAADPEENEARERALQRAALRYTGPLPPSGEFDGYEEVVPGAGDRILTMAEEEARNRRQLARAQVKSGIKSEKRGQWMAFFLSLAVLGCATYLIVSGYSEWGILMFFGQLIAVSGTYIMGRWGGGQEEEGEEPPEEEQLSLADEADQQARENS